MLQSTLFSVLVLLKILLAFFSLLVLIILIRLFREIIIVFLRILISSFSTIIKTQEELRKLLEKERKKLGLLNKNIIATIEEGGKTRSKKLDDGSYLITLGPNEVRTAVAHELYHIYDGAADAFKTSTGIMRSIKYLYWWEPRAVFYELRRLRACNQL